MASSTFKSNPFQKLNPFQLQHSFQTSNFTANISQHHSEYRRYEPASESCTLKQNSYVKSLKSDTEMWKFRDDNCNKTKVFNQNNHHILNQKYAQQKNSFEKQLVFSSVDRRNSNQGQVNQRDTRIQNPFNRKYLVSGKLAQSQIYVQAPVLQNATLDKSHQRTMTDYENYKYNNFNYGQNSNMDVGISKDVYSYALKQNQYQNYSNKSIQDSRSPYNQNSFNLNPLQSRYSLQKQKNNHQNGSYSRMYPPRSSHNLLNGDSKVSGGSRASKQRRNSREPSGSRKSMTQKQNQKVRFDSCQSQRQIPCKDFTKRLSVQRNLSKQELSEMAGPQQILINGKPFYKQAIQSF